MQHYLSHTQQLFLNEMGMVPWALRHTSAIESTHNFSAANNSHAQINQLQQILKSKSTNATTTTFPKKPITSNRHLASPQSEADPLAKIEHVNRIDLPKEWQELADKINTCTNCALNQSKKNYVFGDGDLQAKILIISDAPNSEENTQGQSFVGSVGVLLDSMLAAIGLNRYKNIYLSNIIKCHPPNGRLPLDEEIISCSAYLSEQINLLKPQLIILLGQTAANGILKSVTPISQLRGRILVYDNIPTIVSYHPSYLLKNLPDKIKAWEDLLLIKQHLQL